MTNEKAPERIIVCTDGHKPAIADWAKDKMKDCDIEYVRADLIFSREGFEQWWSKNGDKNWSVKHAAREGWHACTGKDTPSECFDRGYLGSSLEGHACGHELGYLDGIEKVKKIRDQYEARLDGENHPAFAHYYTVSRNVANEIITALERALTEK